MPGSGPEDMERQIDQWAAQIHEKASAYKALTAEREAITGRGEAANGAIRVTVNRAGILTNLELSYDVLRAMRGSQLSAEIMKAMRQAQAGLGAQVVSLMRERVPQDVESIATIADTYARQFPQPEPDDDQLAQDRGGRQRATDNEEDFSGGVLRPIHPPSRW